MKTLLRGTFTVLAIGPCTPAVAQAIPAVVSRPLAIQSMTTIGSGATGYFEDPYPVRFAPSLDRHAAAFSGTTPAILHCDEPVTPDCFATTPVKIDLGVLARAIANAGAAFTNFQNLNMFQDESGRWHAVLAIGVKKRGTSGANHWTVLVHAHANDERSDAVPLSWSADTILSGSFANDVQGNYDGKYYEQDGTLYLLYVKNFIPEPALRNGIVIRRMISPTEPSAEPPVTLLLPGDRFGPLNSEWYDHTPAKLVEAPYIVRFGNKYALIYSTGAYQHDDYKAGVAWSDTLLPRRGLHYRKVLEGDPAGIWGRAGRPEVHYLVQSQKPDWPNDTTNTVFGPGVASVLPTGDNRWSLFFAGYDFADRPTKPRDIADAHHRRPWFIRLHVAVPQDRTVAAASDADLATWLEPETR